MSAIATLTKRVNALTKSTQSKVMYGQQGTVTLGNATGNYIDILPLNRFTAWSRIFGTDADDEQGKRAIIKSTNVQWNVYSNEPDIVGFSMFCVSLKKVGSDLIDTAGNLTGLVQGTHYAGVGSKVLLNMNYFNVHYVKRFVQGSPTIAPRGGGTQTVTLNAAETSSLQKTGKFTVPYGKYGMAISNPAGDWKAAGHPKADTQNHFFLTFSDNFTTDLENPALSWNVVHSALVSA